MYNYLHVPRVAVATAVTHYSSNKHYDRNAISLNISNDLLGLEILPILQKIKFTIKYTGN